MLKSAAVNALVAAVKRKYARVPKKIRVCFSKSAPQIQSTNKHERRKFMNWKKFLEALYGFLGALLGALAGAGCSLMGSGVGMTMH